MNKLKQEFPQLRKLLDTKFVGGLLITILCSITILLLSKISFFFVPIGTFLSIAAVPIIIASLFYYILQPIVSWLEDKNLKRIYAISLVFAVLILLFSIALITVIPIVQAQIENLIENLPQYFDVLMKQLKDLPHLSILRPFQSEVSELMRSISTSLTDFAQMISSYVVSGFESLISKIATVVITLIIFPIILFFLLKDGKKIPERVSSVLPKKFQVSTRMVLEEMSDQVSYYIRGQLLVALCVSIMFTIGFTFVGLEYSLALGILAGVLNLIPYLGSFLATIPALVLAFMGGPILVLKVIILFAVEQLIEGHFISPLVLSSKLHVHPVTILFILLSAGKIFGIFGVILGVPVYAILKVLVVHCFSWVKRNTALYTNS
ncbi:AI-2E family transporter [Enterococcus sp. AZ196]|uniref:AI-2E family transporter n=1 Tax=Enterococcus sp. AZ196 TaxID=2774659 RepID=UPI003D293E72